MGYTTKHIIRFYDQIGEQYIINIQKDGYSGSASYLTATDTPLVINYPDPGERFAAIRGSEARIQFYSDSPYTYLDLFTSGKTEYYINITRNGGAFWHGFLYPSVYQQDLSGAPYVVELTASDGLGRLDQVEFKNDSSYLFGEYSLHNIIFRCLYFANLPRTMKICTGLTSNATTSEFLYNHYLNTFAFIDDDEFLNCKDVINEILTACNCRIYQVKQAFHIIGFTAYNDDTITTQNYDEDGLYSGTSRFDPITITAADASLGTSIFSLLEGAYLSVELPAKEVTVINSFAEKESLMKGNFKPMYWSDTDELEFWDNTDDLTLEQADDNESLFIKGTINRTTTTPDFIKHTHNFLNDTLKVGYIFSFSALAESGITTGANINLMVKYYSGAFTYYLQDDYSWSTSSNYLNIIIPNNKWKDFEIETDVLTMTTTTGNYIEIYISQLFGFGITPSATDGVYIKNFKMQNIAPVESLEKEVVQTVNDDFEESKKVNIRIGATGIERNDIKYVAPGSIQTLSGGLVTDFTNVYDTYDDLSDLLADTYKQNYLTPREVLSCSIFGYAHQTNVIYDSNHSKYYLIVAQSIDCKKGVNDFELYEIDIPETAEPEE